VVQCGYRQSGQIMQAVGLLAGKARADGRRYRGGDGTGRIVCRCATYARIRAAIHDASAMLG
jgi:isoquinoline 1-oxidoreductase alpha subunit